MEDNNNNPLRYDLNYFCSLDSENKLCFDCGGAFPKFVSINNGVFLCESCAQNHKKNLNYNISFIYDLNLELDQYLLSFITRGGNSRFKLLCKKYEVPCMISQNESERIKKYIIRVGEYHRLLLKSEIDCSEPPPELFLENAHEPINMNVIYFPEFENYKLFKEENINKNKNKNFNNGDKDNNMEEPMMSKIWEGTKNTFDVMKSTTGFIYNTSKPIVSFLGNAAYSGIKFLGNSVWNYYMNGKNENSENNNTDNGNNNSENNNKDNIYIGNNTPINDNYIRNDNNGNNFRNNNNENINRNLIYNNNYYNNNNYNINYNNNKFQNNKNYLSNSSKFTIFTINENKLYNNNIDNKKNYQNNLYSKPINNPNNNNNKIPNFYDINSINNESVNNISYYSNNNMNSLSNISKVKNNLLNHKNIIINEKYINNNIFIENNPELINKSKIEINNNNNYPNYNEFEKNKIILDKNVPNIIGKENYQVGEKNSLHQSTNLLNDNSFIPKEFVTDKGD